MALPGVPSPTASVARFAALAALTACSGSSAARAPSPDDALRDAATSPERTEGGEETAVGRDAAPGASAEADAASSNPSPPPADARGGAPEDASPPADQSAPPAGDASTEAAAACGALVFGSGPIGTTSTHLDIGVHDPSMIWDGHRYYLFGTGGTLAVRSSADLLTWTSAGNVFASVPSWVTTALGSNPGSLWAPDVSYFGGSFHVYYAGSTFGSNDSVIGLATSASLAAPSWNDQGLVVQSTTSDDFNAIDPNVAFDGACTPWLAYGSFWSGIHLRKLDVATGKPAADDPAPGHALASRNGGAIEAASIVSHNGFYYLFVSFDACCKGVQSTYRTMVGRATSITGPYTDKAGADMNQGAAEQLLATSGRYIGPGGGTAWQDGDTFLYAFHYYDGDDNGVSKLQIRPITFDSEDWVVLGDALFP